MERALLSLSLPSKGKNFKKIVIIIEIILFYQLTGIPKAKRY